MLCLYTFIWGIEEIHIFHAGMKLHSDFNLGSASRTLCKMYSLKPEKSHPDNLLGSSRFPIGNLANVGHRHASFQKMYVLH